MRCGPDDSRYYLALTMGAPPSNAAEITNVVCPFCGLLCDDLTVTSQRGAFRVTQGICTGGTRAFPAVPAPSAPVARVRGREVPLADAIAEAAQLIGKANQPLIAGLSTDLAGARAAARLADRVGGVVDHMNSAATLRNLLVLQDGGWVTTTLSEVRNHADLLIAVGTDLPNRHPDLLPRYINNRETLFGTVPCEVVHLAPQVSDRPQLTEGLAGLRAILNGRKLASTTIGGSPIAFWEALAAKILAAKYTVFVWAANELEFPHAELTIQTLAELIKDVNRSTRAAGLPLTGTDGEVTVDAVLHWQTGYGVRTSFGRGYPSHDSYHLGAERLLAQKEADLLVWIASFDAQRTPPETEAPRIVLARGDMSFEREPEVFIAVGIPGVDHAGHLFRNDRVIALPLRALRQTQLPSAEYVLDGIATMLGAP